MTGLEKIIEQIRADSDEICNKTKSEAEASAAQIIAQAQAEAEKVRETERERTAQQCANIAERAESGAELERRRARLSAKQELIAEMLANAKKAILELDDEEYFSVLYKMLKKFSSDEQGEIAFNARDLKRLPRDFVDKAKKELALSLELSKTPVDIDGGFLLLYGGIEENCSFSAIFSGESERLSDLASKILFES